MPNQTFKYFGVYALILASTYIIYLTRKYRGGKTMTISSHAASDTTARVQLAVVVPLHTLLLGSFLYYWFSPTFHLTHIFDSFVIFMALSELLIGWIPDVPGKLQRIHHYAAFSVGGFGLLISLLIAVSSHIAPGVRVAFAVYLLASAVGILCFFRLDSIRKHVLIYQIALYWLFFILLLVAAY